MNLNRKKVYLGQSNLTVERPTWYRPILALILGVAIMTLVTFLSGCSQQHCATESYVCDYDRGEPFVTPKLILRSQKERSIDPQTIACRSDWPSTTGDLEFTQITTWRQYWYDRQSASPNISDNSYRQTQSYRFGESIR